MRRIKLVLAVAAVMAALTVLAAPAQAQDVDDDCVSFGVFTYCDVEEVSAVYDFDDCFFIGNDLFCRVIRFDGFAAEDFGVFGLGDELDGDDLDLDNDEGILFSDDDDADGIRQTIGEETFSSDDDDGDFLIAGSDFLAVGTEDSNGLEFAGDDIVDGGDIEFGGVSVEDAEVLPGGALLIGVGDLD